MNSVNVLQANNKINNKITKCGSFSEIFNNKRPMVFVSYSN